MNLIKALMGEMYSFSKHLDICARLTQIIRGEYELCLCEIYTPENTFKDITGIGTPNLNVNKKRDKKL